MNIPDLTPEQDAAFVTLRKYYNRDNPAAPVTKAQLIEMYAARMFAQAVDEANARVTGTELQAGYKSATPEVKAQINTLLGL